MTDFPTVIAIGALGIAGFSLISRMLDKSLSIREHDEYRKAVERDILRVEKRLDFIEQSRPSNDTLGEVSSSLKARIENLERKP